MVIQLFEATRPELALQAEMRRVWRTLDNMDRAAASRLLAAVAEMRAELLDHLTALQAHQVGSTEAFTSSALRQFSAELEGVAERFALRYSNLLTEDMRAVAEMSAEGHAKALTGLAQANGVSVPMIRLSPLGLTDASIEASILLNQSSIKGVSQAVIALVNNELQKVVFGGQSRWEAIKAIRAALGTSKTDLGKLTNRAMTIEQTGLMQMFNIAAEAGYRQAKDELPELQVEWVTVQDRRVDPICTGLSGARKEPGGSFSGGYVAPPAHPRCRCRIVAWMPGWGGALRMRV